MNYSTKIIKIFLKTSIEEMKAGRYVVTWSDVDASFFLEQVDKQSGISFDECMSVIVVGNIYENPELISERS